jgi:glycosyltransferase involved in cell wall biosynthesis
MKADQDFDIDVIIPVYNGEKFIADSLGSAARQTYPARRIIVVDDGCQDRTPEIVRNFPEAGVPIHYVRQPRNLGLSAARNRGIRESSSPYLAFLDADDIWLETKLETQIALFRRPRYAKLGIVSCGHYLVDMDARLLSPTPRPLQPRPRGQVLDRLLTTNLVANGSAALVARACFDAVGLFDESLPTCEDWDMWLRILQHYRFDHSEAPLLKIRQHASNMSRNRLRMFIGHIQVLNKWAVYAKSRPAVLRGLRIVAARQLAAGFRELPRTELLQTLNRHLSPELRGLLRRQALPVLLTLGQGAWLKVICRRGFLVEHEDLPIWAAA